MLRVVYVLAVLAAGVVATGEVLQQRLAARAPSSDDGLSPRLLLYLVRRPRWLAGVAGTFVGDALFALAVGLGSVIRVEAVFTLRLVFALVIAAVWAGRRAPLRDVLAATLISGGLIAFLVVARPHRAAHLDVPALDWAVGIGAVVVLAGALAAFAVRAPGPWRALLLGVGAGALFGLQASLMQRSVRLLGSGGITALLTTWSGYLVVLVALSGMLLVQNAFHAAPLAASYPGVVSAQLLCSIAIGIWVLHSPVRLGPVSLAVGIPALLAMLVGVVLLARSPLVTGAAHHRPPRRPARVPDRGSSTSLT